MILKPRKFMSNHDSNPPTFDCIKNLDIPGHSIFRAPASVNKHVSAKDATCSPDSTRKRVYFWIWVDGCDSETCHLQDKSLLKQFELLGVHHGFGSTKHNNPNVFYVLTHEVSPELLEAYTWIDLAYYLRFAVVNNTQSETLSLAVFGNTSGQPFYEDGLGSITDS